MDRPTDEEAAEMSYRVAESIIRDYSGLTIGGEDHQMMTGQLEARIARCLRAFHHGEGRYELFGHTPDAR